MVWSQFGEATGSALDGFGGMGTNIAAFTPFDNAMASFQYKMPDFGNLFDSTINLFGDNNKDRFTNFGTLAGVIGNGISSYNTAKHNKDVLNYQKYLSGLEVDRRNKNDDALLGAVNRTYGNTKIG